MKTKFMCIKFSKRLVVFFVFCILNITNFVNMTKVFAHDQLKHTKSVVKTEKAENKVNSVNNYAKNGAILIDADSGEELFSKNCDICAPMASTTKIMTALIALENYKKLGIDLDEKLPVHDEAINGEYLAGTSIMGLRKGDKISFRGLLYGLLLMSANEAANEIAIRCANGIVPFIDLMNEKAQELGLKNTTFSSPSGLGEEDVVYKKNLKNRTTAKELAIIAMKAFNHDLFRKIISTNIVKPEDTKIMWDSTLPEYKDGSWIVNSNKLIKKGNPHYYKYAVGIKTGYTEKAGRCLVGAAKKGNTNIISVVLDDPNDWNDTKELFNYGFSQYKTLDLVKYIGKDEIKNIDLCWSGDRDIKFKARIKDPVFADVRNNMKKSINCKIMVDPIYISKLKEGEKIGEIEFYLKDRFLGKSDLISNFRI